MADWRCLTTLDIADTLRDVADEFQEEREREQVRHHHHHHAHGGPEEQSKWTLIGIVVTVVVMVAFVKLSRK